MGYPFALLSIFSNGIKGFCVKKVSNFTNGLTDVMLVTATRMLICTVIGLLIALTGSGFGALHIHSSDLLSIVLSGVSLTVSVVTPLLALKGGACLTLDVFLMLGVIIPLIGGKILFNETILPKQWLGFCILIIAAITLCSYSSKVKTKVTPSFLITVLLIGIASGVNDLSQKLFIMNKSGTSAATFNMYSYLISFVILVFLCGIFRNKYSNNTPTLIDKKVFIYIALMALTLFLGSFFQTSAAAYLPSAKLFPMTKAAGLICTTIMAAVFFNEKINLKCIVGIILAFTGIMIINF